MWQILSRPSGLGWQLFGVQVLTAKSSIFSIVRSSLFTDKNLLQHYCESQAKTRVCKIRGQSSPRSTCFGLDSKIIKVLVARTFKKKLAAVSLCGLCYSSKKWVWQYVENLYGGSQIACAILDTTLSDKTSASHEDAESRKSWAVRSHVLHRATHNPKTEVAHWHNHPHQVHHDSHGTEKCIESASERLQKHLSVKETAGTHGPQRKRIQHCCNDK